MKEPKTYTAIELTTLRSKRDRLYGELSKDDNIHAPTLEAAMSGDIFGSVERYFVAPCFDIWQHESINAFNAACKSIREAEQFLYEQAMAPSNRDDLNP